MKEAFPEFFVEEPIRQQELWKTCLFVLDTNVLLDLYRFSDSSRDALFKVMESLGDRLWIPYQVAFEYFENRLKVIEDQTDAYAKSINGLKAAKEKFNSGSRHPFVSEEVFNKFIESYDLMIKELEDNRKKYLSFIEDDAIKTRIGSLLNGKVGGAYSEDQLHEISVEGEKRYLEGVPPGFQDGGKMPDATTNKLKLKKFGDLILWKQIIEKAAADSKSVVLVTGEKKDDWWLKSDKRLVSALPALSKEFMLAVKKDFYLYATDTFLLKANDYLKQNTSSVVVEEVRAINKADAELASDADRELLDLALNFSWPSSVSDSRSNDLANTVWQWKNYNRSAHGSTDVDLIAQLEVVGEHRAMIQQRGALLRAEIDALRKERDELDGFNHRLVTAGVLLNDKGLNNIRQRLLVLATMINTKEDEVSLLRSQLSDVVKLQRSLMGEEGD